MGVPKLWTFGKPGPAEPINVLYREAYAVAELLLPCLKLERKRREGSHWKNAMKSAADGL